ncbi:protein of unknown function [Methylocella tundrae]|uniref:Uncharacterized protein n=1 Tax=Methylocella tundrae TaxID=227605 RepID=A0A4U8Z3T3_METTU|nr:protein of unknown function [Methylocella tundrae]
MALYPAELRAHLTLPSPTDLNRSTDSAILLTKPQPVRWIATPLSAAPFRKLLTRCLRGKISDLGDLLRLT